jgi:SAM-dependent methyltransferase
VALLEVGCGPGPVVWYLAREGFDVYGIDGSPTAIEHARSRLEAKNLIADLRVGDFVRLADLYVPKTFDAVIDVASIQQNRVAAVADVIGGIFSVLKPSGPINLDNWRRREWSVAVEASGVRKPATPYDMRDTFASNALAAGVTVFELARDMGTSVRMIERHYGALLDGAHAGIAGRLDALEASLARAAEQAAADV